MSKVYYRSSIRCNTSEENIKKVQLIQNYAAMVIVGNVGKYDHVSPLLKELGWLPIKSSSLLLKSDVHKKKSNP